MLILDKHAYTLKKKINEDAEEILYLIVSEFNFVLIQ